MLRTVEYQRGYDAGYKQALVDALNNSRAGMIHKRIGRKVGENGR